MLKKLGFLDVNIALAGTVTTAQQAPHVAKQKPNEREIHEIVERAVSKETKQIREEIKTDMKTLREEVMAEAREYTGSLTAELCDSLTTLRATLGQSMLTIENLTKPALIGSDTSTSSKQINKVQVHTT